MMCLGVTAPVTLLKSAVPLEKKKSFVYFSLSGCRDTKLQVFPSLFLGCWGGRCQAPCQSVGRYQCPPSLPCFSAKGWVGIGDITHGLFRITRW